MKRLGVIGTMVWDTIHRSHHNGPEEEWGGISFALAVFVYDEPFTRHHAIAFALIWSALLVFTLGSARR